MAARTILMGCAFATTIAALGAVAAADPVETDQIAQSRLIGMSPKTLRVCLGKPAQRQAVGLEAIWTYPVGTLKADGPAFVFPLNLNILGAGRPCDVHFVLDRFGVSQIYYTLPGGAMLPLGKLCEFRAEDCVAK